jgi:hypothetical protein
MAGQGRMSATRRRLAWIAVLGMAGAVAGWTPGTTPARAEDRTTPPSADVLPGELPPPPTGDEDMPFTAGADTSGFPAEQRVPARTFISEIVDSSYFVGPAEFFALDLPAVTRGARAVHLFGDVQVQGKGRDVIVRLFRSPDYQDWLKKRSGKEGKALWVSSRSRSVHLDQPLPTGVPVVLLLDNGYSIRTPKQVRVQIQIQYEESGAAAAAAPATPSEPAEGEIIPRSNAADDTPPPPPPPPSDGSN